LHAVAAIIVAISNERRTSLIAKRDISAATVTARFSAAVSGIGVLLACDTRIG